MNLPNHIKLEDFVRYEDNDKVFVGLRHEGILHIYFKPKLILDLETQIGFIEIYRRVSENAAIPYIVESGEFIRLEKEAKEYSIKAEKDMHFISNCVVARNTAQLLIARLYFKIYKPFKPYAIFKTFPKAQEWSLKQKEIYHDKQRHIQEA